MVPDRLYTSCPMGPTVASSYWTCLRQMLPVRTTPAGAAAAILQHFNVFAPAVPVQEIIAAMGIPVEKVSATPWSGAVSSAGSVAKVWVRSTDTPVRQRFTLAHELGHLMLHDLGIAYRDDSFSGGWKEAQANQFAAGLLVPQNMLATRYTPGTAARFLAKQFQVSEPAMKIQIGKLLSIDPERVA